MALIRQLHNNFPLHFIISYQYSHNFPVITYISLQVGYFIYHTYLHGQAFIVIGQYITDIGSTAASYKEAAEDDTCAILYMRARHMKSVGTNGVTSRRRYTR